MYKFKEDQMNIPCYVWSKEGSMEQGAIDQIKAVSSLPFVFKHMAVMPDCHTGYSCPIGSVIATKGVVVPFFVGVDIGCGVMAVQTSLTELSTEDLKKIMGEIRKKVPVGFNHHKEKQTWRDFEAVPDIPIIHRELEKSKYQLGTLGGGNHFIEIQKGDDGYIWIMIHSGSRNFGYQIAKHYNKVAQDLCKRWYSDIPPIKGEDGLAFLPIDSEEGREYLEAMNFALKFAKANRLQMMTECLMPLTYMFDCIVNEEINIHHNYAAMENHFGANVLIHRKGATSARKGEKGIIPGSQGTNSYIVEGLGNPESFQSCSHGAGRKMSRSKAIKELDFEKEKKQLEDQGIIHSVRSKKDLDEAPSAYKNIQEVMEEQKDLVKILVTLQPLAVIKG